MIYGDKLKKLDKEITRERNNLSQNIDYENTKRSEINSLISDVSNLAQQLGVEVYHLDYLDGINVINSETDCAIAEIEGSIKAFPKLSTEDYIVAALSGALSVIIDVIFVGTPEVVKIYRGGENFDGSILTEIIRKINPNDGTAVGEILKWFSDKCKVPYDISCVKGVITPNNHRGRGLAHDPFLGIFFAISDILMGTTTTIDNEGKLRVLINSQTSETEKFLSVVYYLGHIISDMFTARGIPVPGFFLTQFFTGTGADDSKSLAQIANDMYMDGYDMRHLGSMAVPVTVKNMIVELYLKLTKKQTDGLLPLAEKEIYERDCSLKKEKMLFIANAIGTAGNLTKFVAPPNCCNPCALNTAQWFEFIRSSIRMLKGVARDKSADTVLDGRQRINEKWEEIIAD